MLNIKELKFDKKGLIPAIVVDAKTKQVLTLAYMNEESLKISMEKGLTCFFSRSRQELWLKGETSGNYQHIVKIVADCDSDALLVYVTALFDLGLAINTLDFRYESLTIQQGSIAILLTVEVAGECENILG